MEIRLDDYEFYIKPGITENVEKLQMLRAIAYS
jgi:hypothetical protein